jgi:hypothetical protein
LSTLVFSAEVRYVKLQRNQEIGQLFSAEGC